MRLITALSLMLLLIPYSPAEAESIQELNRKIQLSGGKWVAGPTSVSGLSLNQMRAMTDSSLDPHPEVQFEIPESDINSFAVASSFDWRNKDGKNWLSPIRHQGSCGSCLAFAAVATLESQYRISQAKTYKLSPQYLFSCGGGACRKGWYPEQAAKFLVRTGVPEESCLPYSSGGGSDIACNRACPDSEKRAVKIGSYSRPTVSARNLAALREALQKGPLVTTMSAYQDFMNYRSGIYKRVSNSYVGGHAIVLIGYNDKERYLLIRNSWGTSWGESGYARISYDDTSGLGASSWSYEVPKAKVFDLPLLNASLEERPNTDAAKRAPSSVTNTKPDFSLSRAFASKAAEDSFELLLENRSGFYGEIKFHQVHKGSEKVVPVTLSATNLKIRLNANLLTAGEWEFFITAQDAAGKVVTSERQRLIVDP